jgi:hypothetical protein
MNNLALETNEKPIKPLAELAAPATPPLGQLESNQLIQTRRQELDTANTQYLMAGILPNTRVVDKTPSIPRETDSRNFRSGSTRSEFRQPPDRTTSPGAETWTVERNAAQINTARIINGDKQRINEIKLSPDGGIQSAKSLQDNRFSLQRDSNGYVLRYLPAESLNNATSDVRVTNPKVSPDGTITASLKDGGRIELMGNGGMREFDSKNRPTRVLTANGLDISYTFTDGSRSPETVSIRNIKGNEHNIYQRSGVDTRGDASPSYTLRDGRTLMPIIGPQGAGIGFSAPFVGGSYSENLPFTARIRVDREGQPTIDTGVLSTGTVASKYYVDGSIRRESYSPSAAAPGLVRSINPAGKTDQNPRDPLLSPSDLRPRSYNR